MFNWLLVHLRRVWHRARKGIIPRQIVLKNKYMPYMATLFMMKLTVMMLIASQRVVRPMKMAMNSSVIISTPPIEETTSDRYKQILMDNLEHVNIEATATNRTHASSIWLIYNRVPRSGGLTMVFLVKELAKMNRFTHQRHQYRTPWNRLLIEEEQKNLVTWFEYQHLPKSYDRHFLHVNFTSFQRYAKNLRPTYINVLRDPADREYSAFRGRRQDPLQVTTEIKRRDAIERGSGTAWYTKSFSDCVLNEDPECSSNMTETAFSRSIPYFCGQNPECLVPGSRWALQRAKFIVEYEYSVVGILNQMNETLRVLEHYVPRFFTGASQLYYKKGYGRRHENRYIKSKPVLAQPVIDKLKDMLESEYELFDFCKQRLYHQHQKTQKGNLAAEQQQQQQQHD